MFETANGPLVKRSEPLFAPHCAHTRCNTGILGVVHLHALLDDIQWRHHRVMCHGGSGPCVTSEEKPLPRFNTRIEYQHAGQMCGYACGTRITRTQTVGSSNV
jgi:hypothetical protein